VYFLPTTANTKNDRHGHCRNVLYKNETKLLEIRRRIPRRLAVTTSRKDTNCWIKRILEELNIYVKHLINPTIQLKPLQAIVNKTDSHY
jgi:hypothetical protein